MIAIGNSVKHRGDVSASDEAYKKALRIAQELKDKKLILKVLINKAKNESRSGNHIEAIKQLEEIVEVSKEIDYKEVLARAYADLGLIYGVRGDNPLSLQYYLQALEINEKRNDYIGVYDNYINIANIQSAQNDISAALETLNKAQELAVEKQDSMRISLCFTRLGDIYRRANRPEALYYYQKSLSMSRFNKLTQDINNLINIGSIYTDRDEFEKAMASFNEALTLAQQAGIKRVFGEVYAKIGILDFKQKKYGEAEGYIKKALTLAKETSSIELQKIVVSSYQ